MLQRRPCFGGREGVAARPSHRCHLVAGSSNEQDLIRNNTANSVSRLHKAGGAYSGTGRLSGFVVEIIAPGRSDGYSSLRGRGVVGTYETVRQ